MIWRIRFGVLLVAVAVVSALVWFDLSSWWSTLLVGLGCAAVDGALIERFVRGPKVRVKILSLLGEGYELSGKAIVDAVRNMHGHGPVYRHLEQLEAARLVSSRRYPYDSPNVRRRLYAITEAGRAALWSNAQDGER